VIERANMRRDRVQRLGKAVASLDLYDYLLRGDTAAIFRLETGDVVFVPVHDYAGPNVGSGDSAGIYELKTGEQLGDLIAASGGFRADARAATRDSAPDPCGSRAWARARATRRDWTSRWPWRTCAAGDGKGTSHGSRHWARPASASRYWPS